MNDSVQEQEFHLAHMQLQRTLGYHHDDPHGASRLDNVYESLNSNPVGHPFNSNGSDIQEDLRFFANADGHNADQAHHEHQHQQLQHHYLQHGNQFSSSEEQRNSHREHGPGEPGPGPFGHPMSIPHNVALYHQQQLHNQAIHAMAHPHYQNLYQNPAVVPIPQMVQLSNIFANSGHQHPTMSGASSSSNQAAAQPAKTLAPLHPVVHDGEPPKPRSFEEEYAIIIQRTASAAAKSSNTKYRCLFCNFTFVGGPQKIRVHLTGKRENGTRLSRCENCPEEVRKKLEERMKAPKELVSDTGLFEDTDANTPSLPPRNVEEHHCVVLSRSGSSNSKSSNTRYKCIYCRFKFVGGPQKIRVHLTGQPEGGTRMAKCSRVPAEVIEQMELRRKAPRPDLLSVPSAAMQGLEQGGAQPSVPTPASSASTAASSSGSNSAAHGGNHAQSVPVVPIGTDLLSLPPSAHVPPSLAAHLAQQTAQQQRMQQSQASHAQHLHIQQQQQQHLANLQRQQQIQQQQQQLQQQQLQHHQQIQHHLQQYHQQQQQHQMHQQLQQQHQHQQAGHLPLGMLPHPQHVLHAQGLPVHMHAQQHMMQHPSQALLHQQQQHLQRQQHQQMQGHPSLGAHSSAPAGILPPHHVFHNAQANVPIVPTGALGGQGHSQSLPAHLVLQQPFPSLLGHAPVQHPQGSREPAPSPRLEQEQQQGQSQGQEKLAAVVAVPEREDRRQLGSPIDSAGVASSREEMVATVEASTSAARVLESLHNSQEVDASATAPYERTIPAPAVAETAQSSVPAEQTEVVTTTNARDEEREEGSGKRQRTL